MLLHVDSGFTLCRGTFWFCSQARFFNPPICVSHIKLILLNFSTLFPCFQFNPPGAGGGRGRYGFREFGFGYLKDFRCAKRVWFFSRFDHE